MQCASSVMGGKRDYARVIFEIECTGLCDAISSGGIPADNAIVEQGRISHFRSGAENRYQVPIHLISINAIWFCHESFPKVEKTAMYAW